MGAFWGGLAAVGIGVADLFGRRIVIATSAITAAFLLQVMGALASLALVVVVPSVFAWDDAGWGMLSGLGLATGLGCYYLGLSRSSSTIVSPIVATLSAVIPYTYAVIRGGEVSPLAAVGAALAFVGLAVIGSGAIDRERLRAGLWWGTISGLGYGFGISALVEVADDAGVWPAVWQRMAAVLALGLVARSGGHRLLPPRSLVGHWVAGGLFTGLVSVFILLGFAVDAPSTVVATSMFPVPAVMVGVGAFGDRISWRQTVGIALALVGVGAVVGG